MEGRNMDTQKINIEGFWNYSQVHPKHKNDFKHLGFIPVLAKTHVRFGLKLVEDTEVFLWFHLGSPYFN